MAIESLCNTFVITIDEAVSLAEASRVMYEARVSSVVVVKMRGGKRIPVGMLTDRDLALAVNASAHPKRVLVSQVMNSRPTLVNKHDGVFEATIKMRENGVERMPVVDNDGVLFGIITADNLLDLMSEELRNVAHFQQIQSARVNGFRESYRERF